MGIHNLAFKIIRNKTKKLTLLKAAGYFFMFAVCAKLVYFVEAGHPAKEKLMPVQGVVREVKSCSIYVKDHLREVLSEELKQAFYFLPHFSVWIRCLEYAWQTREQT